MQPVRSGSVILEINLKSNASELLAKSALKSIQRKLPFKSKVVVNVSNILY